MIVLLSPAKTLDENPVEAPAFTHPRLLKESGKLVRLLKKKSAGDLQELMGISEKLATLNVQRYKTYKAPFEPTKTKPAALMFKGDVYLGLEAGTFSESEMAFAQNHIRILSGLYGLLRPMDLMHPYRLEMGTKLGNGTFKNLYEFWNNRITKLINEDLAESGSDVVLNLASNEYFHAVKTNKLKAPLLNIQFKEDRDGKLKVISFNAKKARGRMSHLIVKEQIAKSEDLKSLVVDDYTYRADLSDDKTWLFVK